MCYAGTGTGVLEAGPEPLLLRPGVTYLPSFWRGVFHCRAVRERQAAKCRDGSLLGVVCLGRPTSIWRPSLSHLYHLTRVALMSLCVGASSPAQGQDRPARFWNLTRNVISEFY